MQNYFIIQTISCQQRSLPILQFKLWKTAGIRCFVLGRSLGPAQATLACLPSNHFLPRIEIAGDKDKLYHLLWSRRRVCALGGRARKTAGIRCFVLSRSLGPAQATLTCLPSNPFLPRIEIAGDKDKLYHLLWSRRRDLNPRPLGPEPSALPTALHLDI